MKNTYLSLFPVPILKQFGRLMVAVFLVWGLWLKPSFANTINVDVSKETGLIRPTVVGQMMEWAQPQMNRAWAEKLNNRSFEAESIFSGASPLYDAFTGTSLDTSRWTTMNLDTNPAGSVSVANSLVTISSGSGGNRYGIMSNDLMNSRYAHYTVETKITSFTGTNAILSLYGGTGASDFSKYVEFAIENGVLKVFADGVTTWTGGSATTPATLKVEVTPLDGNNRDIKFYYNGTLQHTLSSFDKLADPFRVFLYSWDGNVSYEYLTINPDDTYDEFSGTSLSPRWTPTRLAGSNDASVTVNGSLQMTGGVDSRSGVLSDYISNSALDWTTIEAEIKSYTGTNALLNLYGGSGSGDFSKFVEYGIENGVLKVYTDDGTGNWTGGSVTLPATLSVRVSPYYASGRQFSFFLNGVYQHTVWHNKNLPQGDFRLFLYGWSNSTTEWDNVKVSQWHPWSDLWAPHFEGGPGLSVEWTPIKLAGNNWGTAIQGSGQLQITGGTNSRYGVMSQRLEESDFYGYTIEAKLDSYTGTNGLLNLYAGSGRDNFSKFVEFGIEGVNNTVKVFGDGLTTFTGASNITLPARLRIEVSPWNGTGRDFYFFLNDQLVHWYENVNTIPNQEYQIFLYGWSNSVTKWDYLTFWRNQGSWATDGYADRATYSHEDDSYNGTYSVKISNTQHNSGRRGIQQSNISIRGGHTYDFSVWLKQSGLTTPVKVYLGPSTTSDGSSYTPYASSTISSVASTWTKYTLSLMPNTTDEKAKLFIGTEGTGDLWIDIPSLMPTHADEVRYGNWNKDFIDKVESLDPKIIRWPGGIIADWYDWEDGVGSRDQRAPLHFAQWKPGWLTNDVGTDEILKLAQDLGLDVILNVNQGTSTETKAANWVEYTNGSGATTYGAQRVTNGYTSPWDVKHWEIGNEVWGTWTPGYILPDDIQDWVDRYILFRDAMNAKDSTLIYIGEGGDGNITIDTAEKAKMDNWNDQMVSQVGAKVDHLSVHYYRPQQLPQAYNSGQVYDASVGSPFLNEMQMQDVQSSILTQNDEDIKVAMTEFNAMYFHEEHRRTRTLEAALQVAGDLNLYARNPQLIETNAYSTLMNFWDGGSIRLSNRGVFVTPSYEVLKLFGEHHGEVLVESGVSTPTTFNTVQMGNMVALSNVPYLDVTATRNASANKLYLSVVNRHPTSALSPTLNLNNAGTITPTATVYLVNSTDYLDQNTWQNPTLVTPATTTISGVSSSFTHSFPAHSYSILEIDVSPANENITLAKSLIGRVLDTNDSPINGATVQILEGTTVKATTTTDTNGYYLFQNPNTTGLKVDVKASKTGYSPFTLNNVDLHSSQGTTALPIKL